MVNMASKRNKETKEKKIKNKQRYKKGITCLLIVTINYKNCLPLRTKIYIKIWKENRSKKS